ncbi:MAG: carboxylating nicotinate-nucleotide diphosphorylase [Dysgonamonadaceae bacterium]|jgi:nicotinate-nucleotide pyrophosphorylase (carboxylating)|nr:carboxylating nicotinate-nucleotide diphosphorylase [Dysgonamonadaceae bacterium]
MDVFKESLIEDLIVLALNEDIGIGDCTTLSCVSWTATGRMHLLVKEDGILAGVEAARKIFNYCDPRTDFVEYRSDKEKVQRGDIAFEVFGSARSLLQIERFVLNVMQRMTGIANATKRYVDLLEGTKTRVLDTRKTAPGMRVLDKEAVRIGGGVNHRFGLYDMVLIKDNHIDFAGGVGKAIRKAKAFTGDMDEFILIEVEVRNFDELNEALETGLVHRIMLDNFSVADTKQAVDLIAGRCETESSGGITLDTARAYAEAGVDFISVGELTHSVKSFDLSLKFFE